VGLLKYLVDLTACWADPKDTRKPFLKNCLGLLYKTKLLRFNQNNTFFKEYDEIK
jgi:hypothetical protein